MLLLLVIKVLALPRGDAVVVGDIISLCKNSSLVKYYSKLKGDYSDTDKILRGKRINETSASMCVYYKDLQLINESRLKD